MDKTEISLEKRDVCVGVMGGGVYCSWIIGVMEGDRMGERRVWFKHVISASTFESSFLAGRTSFFHQLRMTDGRQRIGKMRSSV